MAQNYELQHTPALTGKTVFPDANILIYRYFPDVNPDKFTLPYGLAYNRLRKQGTRLVATTPILTEVANRVYKVDGHFFDGAVCTLYGDFSADFVDSHIEVVDVLDEDVATLRDMREMRKYYYFDRPFYDKLISKIDPILGYNDGFIRDNEITCEADMDFNYKLENK